MSAAQLRALRALAEPIVAAFDADLEDVVIRPAGKRRIVRVAVDRDGGLSLDLVAAISRAISGALDDVDLLGGAPYVLEVTSPGVDRPLAQPRHWRRATGRLVEVVLGSGEAVTGRVLEAGAAAVAVQTESGPRTIGYAEVRRATVQVEFSRIDDAALDDAEDEGAADEGAADEGADDQGPADEDVAESSPHDHPDRDAEA